MKVWCIRAEFGKHADHFCNGGYVAIDYAISEPLPIDKGKDAFNELYKKYNPDDTNTSAIGQRVGQIRRFCEEIKAGDYVITPSSNTDVLYYGKVLDEPYYFEAKPSDGCPFRHRRKVEWSEEPIFRSTFTVPFQNTIRSLLTVFGISQENEFLTTIRAEGYETPKELPAGNPYDKVIKQILELDDKEFEVLVGHLLAAIGFEATEVTGKIGDGGVDVTGVLNVSNLVKVKIYVQAKRYQQGKNISGNVVKQLRMAIPVGGQGAFIATVDFGRSAYDIAVEEGFPRIGLINGRQLVDLLVEHWEDIPDDFQSKLGLEPGLVPV